MDDPSPGRTLSGPRRKPSRWTAAVAAAGVALAALLGAGWLFRERLFVEAFKRRNESAAALLLRLDPSLASVKMRATLWKPDRCGWGEWGPREALPLEIAAAQGRVDIMLALLRLSAPPKTDVDDALRAAFWHNRPECIQALSEAGAETGMWSEMAEERLEGVAPLVSPDWPT